MKLLLRSPILLTSIFLIISFPSCNQESGGFNFGNDNYELDFEKLKTKAEEALAFNKSKGFSEKYAILIDMSIHSGRKRFFFWDFDKKEIAHSFLVSHGCCNGSWSSDSSKDNPTFSNVPESHCSSVGKYQLGERGYSQWGVNVKYLMHGLESTNNNALRRVIVFHSWEAVPNKEVYPRGTPEGWGCPAISNENFRTIDPLINNESKPVLMWIYES